MHLSPLDRAHRQAGARMVAFGGWEMPVSYPTGTLVEHRTCRGSAVAFDVSHLGSLRVTGPEAAALLQANLTNDLDRIRPGCAQYTHLLDEYDGSVLDDLIVWWVHPGEFHVMPNAANTSSVQAILGGTDITRARAVIAVQGPDARRAVAELSIPAASVPRFRLTRFEWEGEPCVAAGTGYTGEDGVECALPVSVALSFWSALMEAGVAPAGLGARDTLRLEAGLPLHGHELGPGITPAQAGLDWVVAWDKPTFRGREALLAERHKGLARRLAGLLLDGRQPPRAGYPVKAGGRVIGEVTSGNYSPTLETGIALAFLPPYLRPGADVIVDARGTDLEARVVSLPFVVNSA
ncbi:MAG: glycine cleavage system aminomethyltransferase GcvT [Acidimicrobiales bacterium]